MSERRAYSRANRILAALADGPKDTTELLDLAVCSGLESSTDPLVAITDEGSAYFLVLGGLIESGLVRALPDRASDPVFALPRYELTRRGREALAARLREELEPGPDFRCDWRAVAGDLPRGGRQRRRGFLATAAFCVVFAALVVWALTLALHRLFP